jgi:hypothetical protein
MNLDLFLSKPIAPIILSLSMFPIQFQNKVKDWVKNFVNYYRNFKQIPHQYKSS